MQCTESVVQGSMFSSLGSEQLNLFLSAAKGDGIFIWDLRTQRYRSS